MPARDFQAFKLLDLGDFVGVSGHLFRTRTDELTIWASRLTFLAKCLAPAAREVARPAGHRDPLPPALPRSDRQPRRRGDVFEARSRTLAAMRDFLDARGYLEVETPMMQPLAGGALARPFVTHHNALDMRLYLRIAPELYLKRLLVGGMERVYEINRNFRNEGISTQHNPEFTMLEFYQAYSNYLELMTMTEEMLAAVAREVTGGEDVTVRRRDASTFRAPFRRLPMRGAVARGGVRAGSGRDGGRGGTARRWTRRGRSRGQLGVEIEPGMGAGQDHGGAVRGAVGGVARPADVRLRLPDRGVAAVQAEAGRPGHRRAVRAVRRRVRAGQRLQRAERPGRAAAAVRAAAGRARRRATRRRTRWTRTTSAPSSTACRRPAARAWASTGS